MESPPARLSFCKLSEKGTDTGEILLGGGTVRLLVDEGLRNRLLRTADRVDRATLMYGATAFMGFAAVGATLVARRKTVWGYLFLLLAGLLGIAGGNVRRIAKNATRLLDSSYPKSDVFADLSPEGDLAITFGGKVTFRFAPGEFDPAEAKAFVAALRGG